MISCDRCGKNIGEPLDSQTYKILCKRRNDREFVLPDTLYGAIQLCNECLKKVREAVLTAVQNCLKNE